MAFVNIIKGDYFGTTSNPKRCVSGLEKKVKEVLDLWSLEVDVFG